MKPKIEIDEQIYQDMVKFYGDIYNLPPLSAKIYAYLIFDFEKNGVTFDELVEIFCASKSSVSTNLQFLIRTQLIKDISKLDERKRYFIVNQDSVKIRFEGIVQKMEAEMKILEALKVFNQNENSLLFQRYDIYKSLLEKNIDNIKDSLNKL